MTINISPDEQAEIELIKENNENDYICNKCLKTYKSKVPYEKHIEKCQGPVVKKKKKIEVPETIVFKETNKTRNDAINKVVNKKLTGKALKNPSQSKLEESKTELIMETFDENIFSMFLSANNGLETYFPYLTSGNLSLDGLTEKISNNKEKYQVLLNMALFCNEGGEDRLKLIVDRPELLLLMQYTNDLTSSFKKINDELED